MERMRLQEMGALQRRLGLGEIAGTALHNGKLYIASVGRQNIRVVNLNTGIIETLAGTGGASSAGDGGASSASVNGPRGMAIGPEGRYLYFTEYAGHKVRRIDLQTEIIETFAGSGANAYPSQEDIVATSSVMRHPTGVAVSPFDGDVYISGRFYSIRRVGIARQIISGFPMGGDAGTYPISLFADDGTEVVYHDVNIEIYAGTPANPILVGTPFNFSGNLQTSPSNVKVFEIELDTTTNGASDTIEDLAIELQSGYLSDFVSFELYDEVHEQHL